MKAVGNIGDIGARRLGRRAHLPMAGAILAAVPQLARADIDQFQLNGGVYSASPTPCVGGVGVSAQPGVVLGNLDLTNAFLAGDSFQVFDWTGVSPTGRFTITSSLNPGQFQWDTSNLLTQGIVTLDAVVPEPASVSLLAAGALALLGRRRRTTTSFSA